MLSISADCLADRVVKKLRSDVDKMESFLENAIDDKEYNRIILMQSNVLHCITVILTVVKEAYEEETALLKKPKSGKK